ncbi:unnamed protein product [Lactuca saligna]|uniref:Uncharacterized protein n=1 Tax=Lactuca saligna TaxID=75948 RepID=A0AA36EF67_LACSI|nr:unnamed protein product [Lactuca saligna]
MCNLKNMTPDLVRALSILLDLIDLNIGGGGNLRSGPELANLDNGTEDPVIWLDPRKKTQRKVDGIMPPEMTGVGVEVDGGFEAKTSR